MWVVTGTLTWIALMGTLFFLAYRQSTPSFHSFGNLVYGLTGITLPGVNAVFVFLNYPPIFIVEFFQLGGFSAFLIFLAYCSGCGLMLSLLICHAWDKISPGRGKPA